MWVLLWVNARCGEAIKVGNRHPARPRPATPRQPYIQHGVPGTGAPSRSGAAGLRGRGAARGGDAANGPTWALACSAAGLQQAWAPAPARLTASSPPECRDLNKLAAPPRQADGQAGPSKPPAAPARAKTTATTPAATLRGTPTQPAGEKGRGRRRKVRRSRSSRAPGSRPKRHWAHYHHRTGPWTGPCPLPLRAAWT